MSLTSFERIRDGLYGLASALEDVDADLAGDGDFEAAFRHLYKAAGVLRSTEIEVSPVR